MQILGKRNIRPKRQICHACCAIIVHGKSEKTIAEYVKSNLRLKMEIISKDKGEKSIQINVLNKFLQQREFSNLKTFADKYDIAYNCSQKCLENFRLFIVMDTDDCTPDMREKYISGEMFKQSVLADYICPIYDSPDLEEVMLKAGYMKERISDKEKDPFYSKLFPICHDGNEGTIREIEAFASKMRSIKNTNLEILLEYCLEQAGKNKIK